MSYTEATKDLAGAAVITTGIVIGLGFMAYGIYKFYDEYIKEDLDPIVPDTEPKAKEEESVKEEVQTPEEVDTTSTQETVKEEPTVVQQSVEEKIHQGPTAKQAPVEKPSTTPKPPPVRIRGEDLKPSVFPTSGSVEDVVKDLIQGSTDDDYYSRITDPPRRDQEPPRRSSVQFGSVFKGQR